MTFTNFLTLLSDPGKWEDVLELDTHFRQFEGAERILHPRHHTLAPARTHVPTGSRQRTLTPPPPPALACCRLLRLLAFQTSASAPRPGTRTSPSSSGCGSAWTRRRTTKRTRGSSRHRRDWIRTGACSLVVSLAFSKKHASDSLSTHARMHGARALSPWSLAVYAPCPSCWLLARCPTGALSRARP